MKNKIITYPKQIRKILKIKNKVLVGGCFDILHIGHIIFLSRAAEAGDNLLIALESDEFIRVRKKRKPFHCQTDRAKILSHLSIVDYVILLPYLKNFNDYNNLVKNIKPGIIAVTDNDPQLNNKKFMAEKIGAEIKIVTRLIKNQSTTRILKKINY